MHPPFFQGVLVPLITTNPVRFMTYPCLTNPFFKNEMTKFLFSKLKRTHTTKQQRNDTT